MKLLCDQMMGTLAKWLRLLGFDVYYANEKISDDELLVVAEKEKRVIVSRDKQLVERARKRKLTAVEVASTELDEQLRLVTSIYPVRKERVLSRCSLCNTELIAMDKTVVKEKVPTKVFAAHDMFWYCKKCDKVYWKGSHWDKIEKKMKELTKKG